MSSTTSPARPFTARRDLLATASATAIALALPGRFVSAAGPVTQGALLACAQAPDGRFQLQQVGADGSTAAQLGLPDRGHGVAVSPDGAEAVVLARRPGTFALVFDPHTLALRRTLHSRVDRHYCGHGSYAADGRWFYTTENDFDNGVGVIGVHDVADGYRRVAELLSGGVGPHDCALDADGRSLLVANGGILTHPDLPRAKLNLDTMRPNLARIDLRAGAVSESFALAPALHRLSVRHLAVDDRGRVFIGLQDEHETPRPVPLVAVLDVGAARLRLLDAPTSAWQRMSQYVGSVGLDAAGGMLVATAPRGDMAACWGIAAAASEPRYRGQVAARDVGGVCRGPTGRGVWLTGGDGMVRSAFLDSHLALRVATERRLRTAFDNHAFAA